LPTNNEKDLLEAPGRHAALPLYSYPLSGSLPLSVFLSREHARRDPSSPPSIAAVPRHPLLLRASPQLHLTSLHLLADEIDQRCPESPPTPPFSLQEPTAAAPKYAAAGTSPAKPPPPASLG
jgi:hypothetical protein